MTFTPPAVRQLLASAQGLGGPTMALKLISPSTARCVTRYKPIIAAVTHVGWWLATVTASLNNVVTDA